jgi:hypothetical protein
MGSIENGTLLSGFGSRHVLGALGAGIVAVLAACTSSSATPSTTCSDGGAAARGAADTHCAGKAQPTDVASCHPDVAVGDDGGPAGDDGGGGDDAGDIGNCGDPAYGATMFGNHGGDDDCKYDVTWSAPPICEGQPIIFTVTVKSMTDQSAVTGANVTPDVVLNCNHATPAQAAPSPETPSGTYKVGPVVFDKPGRWVVRFHIHGECADLLPTSQHGHAAFWVDVP